MSNIYKGQAPHWRSMTPINRRELQEFPEEVETRYVLEIDADAEPEPEPEPVDPEAIRAAVFEEAREEAERLVQEAYAEGLRRGEEAGRTAFEEQMQGRLEVFNAAAEALCQAHEAFLSDLEPEVAALSVLMAEHIIKREISLDASLVVRAARQALRKLTDRRRLTIRVHPDDYETLKLHEADLLGTFHDIVDIALQADEEIARGGCIVDTAVAQADARLETMLAELMNAMEG